MSGLWGSSGEVACGIDSVLRLIRFFAETADATARQNLRLDTRLHKKLWRGKQPPLQS